MHYFRLGSSPFFTIFSNAFHQSLNEVSKAEVDLSEVKRLDNQAVEVNQLWNVFGSTWWIKLMAFLLPMRNGHWHFVAEYVTYDRRIPWVDGHV